MSTIHLRIYDLRKANRMSQKELADGVGVSVQTVSKWENNVCMPDITMLPEIAGFFQVTVDELLGLSPLAGEGYIPVRSGEKDYWESRLDYLKASRRTMWNDDYLRFLVKQVWKIDKPIDVLDCGCGFGYMGFMLLPLLPDGSTYTGIDFSTNMLREGEKLFAEEGYQAEFICDDFLQHTFQKHYDITLSQCAMRHVNEPRDFLRKMIAQTKPGGLVIAIDVNRELESDGIYIDGLEYSELCSRMGFRKMWAKEKECQGRDYAIGMRMPLMMRKEGLIQVDVRMNDRVTFAHSEREDYAELVECFMGEKNWRHSISPEAEEEVVRGFINHGMNRKEAESYCRRQRKIQAFVTANQDDLQYLHYRGLLISYGWKKYGNRF
ncbi:MAG: methyltransferase domain-containing protein [Lachnospiraceae bacterium]|nr:methyltransferase domain-containing protein [Lachnospiraceae bacterium]